MIRLLVRTLVMFLVNVKVQVPTNWHIPRWEFPKMGVPYFGGLIRRILLFRVLHWDALFLESPRCTLSTAKSNCTSGEGN